MTSKLIALRFLAGTAAVLLSSASLAQDPDRTGWFVGGEIFQSTDEVDGGPAFLMDDKVIGLGAYGGYHFTPVFGLEANISLSDDFSDDRDNLRRAQLSTVSVMPKLIIPTYDSLAFFIKGGLVFVDYSEDYRDTDNSWYDNDASWSDLVMGMGIGAQMEVSPGLNVRLSYDYTDGELSEDAFSDDAPVRDIDVRLQKLAFGLHYQF